MQNLVNEYQEKFSAERKARRRVTSLFLALAMVVGLGVSWRLKMTGIAMTEEPVLATAETAAAVPVAAQATADTAASAPAQQVAVTPDLGADLETESDWMATLPQLAGTDWAADLVAVAESQLGYAESTRNFAVADDGVTLNGYTRYGAWYGNPRGEWNGMFAAFCLHYAGVPDAYMPSAAGAFAFTAALADKGLYHSAGYTPVAGDLVFFGVKNEDGTAAANRVGIVDKAETDENGTLQLTVIEGDLDNAVKTAQYAAGDGAIVGYGSLAEAFAQYKADTGAAADPKAAASAAATPETAWQAGSLRYVDTDYTVIVAYSESSRIPADASLSVRELEKGSDEYNTYYQKTVAALVTNGTAASASDVRLSFIRLFDVNILQNGQKLEPATPVQISIVYAQPFATPENAVAERQIVHFANAGTEIIDPKVTTMPDGQQSVAYRQGSFSIIADTAALNPESTTLFSADPVNPIDLSSYIQGAVLQKQVNGVWTAATEFNNGDSFKGKK